ncbi:uncharacterized protein [Panulirus ornatus]|uniref:uncharacterized protein isoform X2 n=1 Tax=Panulirus ornatus TaxID=150431 RepID=UPI003A87097D
MSKDIYQKTTSTGSGTSNLCSVLLMVESSANQQKEEQFQLSRDEKEKLLNQKMESIRRKNEELRRRHQEIEADKKNADKLSSTVTMDAVKPYVMKVPRARPEKSDRTREILDQPPPPRPADIMPARQRLTENDGPPPDPSYRFLSDPDRDGIGGGRDNRKEHRGRGGKGRGKHGGKGVGGGTWEGSLVDGRESERGGRGNGRGTRGGYNFSRGEDDIITDITVTDEEFRGQGGSGRGRGRGRNIGNFDKFDGDQGHEFGGGRGRGIGNDRARQENENHQLGDYTNISPSGNSRGEGVGKGRFSFASRDIRYYPDDNNEHGNERHGRGRGKGNYVQQQSFDNYDGNRRLRERGRGRGSFEHRGRGRGIGQHHEYEKWKAEREAIDEARVTRGRTNDGTWRREWDNDKLELGDMDESEPFYDPRYPRSKGEGIKLGDFVTLPCSDDRVSSQPQSGHHRGQQGDHRPIGNRGSQGNYRSQGHSIDPELNGKFVRVGSGRMVKPALQTCQNEQGDEAKSWSRDKQHHRGRGSGKKNLRGRGGGQGQGRINSTNEENSPSMWVRSGGDAEGAPISAFNEGSQSHQELTSASSAFISSAQCPKRYHNKAQESSNPKGQVINLTPSDIPADDSSWTGATSGSESLDTSALSSEGNCLEINNQEDEDAPVQKAHQGAQCVSSDLNASHDETEEYIDTKKHEDQEEECNKDYEDIKETKHTEENCQVDEISSCLVSEDDKVSITVGETLVDPKMMELVLSEPKKEENGESTKQSPADELKILSDIDVAGEDSMKPDRISTVDEKDDTDAKCFPKENNGETNTNEKGIITETENKRIMTNDILKDPDETTTKDDLVCGAEEVVKEEGTRKAAVANCQEVLTENASNEDKMPESCSTPASPTKTEQLVPNIEWK